MDTANHYGVGLRGDKIVFPHGLPMTMSKDDALLFAAWVVLLADRDGKFAEILAKVQDA